MADPKGGVAETAKIFTHGGSQAVRLPKAFRFEGKEVRIRRDGDAVVLEPVDPKEPRPRTPEEWAAFWAKMDALCDEPFPELPPRVISEPVEPW
ncbi:AbrB/MazE/SpoVT family DNA-binding domain-containing protein [Brevundimonas sp.]|jgi:antitoxin VapB|uniref:antitoxin n=1 Tax=Brevundimonas sp. TaxID=1871086 RepID=UPI0026239B9C|nr:AbrB/MazE/SpoVT family DNA-binding domain-containing protein [Brevundimonas sp.]